ncbi:MAG: aspartate-semialdehyde dehydrogenase [Rhodothermales bacterium]|nr:aspartate-semialdehyde dehydrogenase [Rhodothermales bacterium]
MKRRDGTFSVGILGATGAVGQMFVRLLQGHPWFDVTHLVASERSAGRSYGEAVSWVGSDDIPVAIAALPVVSPDHVLSDGNAPDFVFSGLDSSVAGELEARFESAGVPVISNARNHRMEPDVPLLIPDINPSHSALIEARRARTGSSGFIATNPNCSTVGLATVLHPLHDAFGVRAVQVATMQALSGAGYPGLSAIDTTANVIPYIAGEEEKLASEPLKILGRLEGVAVHPADFVVSAQCSRVPVVDGHVLNISVGLANPPGSADETVSSVRRVLDAYRPPASVARLPSAVDRPIVVTERDDRPQPVRDVLAGGGMTVTVGRIRACEVLDVKFTALVHNTVRGAAGCAVLNAEYLASEGYFAFVHENEQEPAYFGG